MYAAGAVAVFPPLGRSVAVFPRLCSVGDAWEALEEDAANAADDAAARIELESLYRVHSRRIYALAWRIVGDREEALDIVQEAFVKAHQSLHCFRGRRPHYAWLHRVVINICIDRRRRRDRWSSVEAFVPEALWPRGEGTSDDPERSVGRHEIQQAILLSLQQLSPSHRMVITLREFGGISYTEIAEIMSCRRGTVMSRLFHARRKLRAILEENLKRSQLEQAS